MEREKVNSYENYPSWIVIIATTFSCALYATGAFIMYQLGGIWLFFYCVYLLFLEIRLTGGHCINCYYFWRACAFGKGKISCLFFKRGDPQKFNDMKITWKSIIPDLMVSMIPLIVGLVIVIKDFSWLLASLLVILFLLTSVGNGFIRGQLACKYCKQREIGCPAERLFNKNKNAG